MEASQQSRPAEKEEPQGESKVAVIAAIIGNILVGVVKFIAAGISGSSAMISEGIHSLVDSGNGILILLGMKKAAQDPDIEHPFGYGKELYFWTLVVSLLIFALGGGISIMEGIKHITAIEPGHALGDPFWNYVVIVAAMVIEGASLSVALKQFNAARGDIKPLAFIRCAKDPSLFTVVLEDSAAEAGLLVALAGVFFSHMFNNPYLDGGASVVIGLLLCCVAIILLRETKGLLVGEGMSTSDVNAVRTLVESDDAVQACGRILSMYVGPERLLITIDANFKHECSADDVISAIDRIEAAVHAAIPNTGSVFIEAENLASISAQRKNRGLTDTVEA